MSFEDCTIPVRNPGGEFLFYTDTETAIRIIESEKGRRQYGGVALFQRMSLEEFRGLTRAFSVRELSRGQRMVYKDHNIGQPGDGHFAFTFKDLLGVSIRLRGEKPAPTSLEVDPEMARHAETFFNVLHSIQSCDQANNAEHVS